MAITVSTGNGDITSLSMRDFIDQRNVDRIIIGNRYDWVLAKEQGR